MSELGTKVEGTTLRFEHVLPGPAETVWEYLTNPGHMETWLARARMEHREGGWVDLMFDTDETGAHIVGVVDVFAPPRVVAYSWNDAEHPEFRSHVTFELIKEPNAKVRITVTHEGLSPEAINAYGAAWQRRISLLDSVLSGKAV